VSQGSRSRHGLYQLRTREPDERLLQALHVIGSQIGQFLARQEQQRHIVRLTGLRGAERNQRDIVRVREREELPSRSLPDRGEGRGFALHGSASWTQNESVEAMAWDGVGEDYIG